MAVLCAASTSLFSVGAGATTAKSTTPARVSGGTLVVAFPDAMDADLKGLDPNLGEGATYANSIYSTMFDQLVYQDPTTGKLVGGLASSWTVSKNGLVYTFHLKTTPKWWNGKPVTASDVAFTMYRATSTKFLPGNAYPSELAVNYSHSVVVNPHEIKMYLKARQPNFLTSVVGRTYFDIVPEAYVNKVGNAAFDLHPMGSGPFEFVRWVANQYLLVKRNPKYTWGPSFFQTAGHAPSVAAIKFEFIPDPTTRLAAIESGEINATITIPPFNQKGFEHNPRYTIVDVQKRGGAQGIYLNTANFPTNELAVRKAIAYALNRTAINRVAYAGTETADYDLLNTADGNWNSSTVSFPKYNLAKADSILTAAGWKMGSDGVRVNSSGQKLTLTAVYITEVAPEFTYIQSELAAAGIQLTLTNDSDTEVDSTLESVSDEHSWNVGNFVENGWTNEDPQILKVQFYGPFAPPNGDNVSYYNNPTVNSLLVAGGTDENVSLRHKAYWQAEAIITKAVPFVPLFNINQDILEAKGVYGIEADYRGTYTYYDDVWLTKAEQAKFPS